jgi:type III secretory pathway lipoprotein EscJ
MTLQKKQTIAGMAYENIKVTLPKTTNSAKAQASQAKKAYKLAKSDAKKIIKDAKRQRKQAKYAYRASKLTLKAKKYDKK